MHDFMQSLQMRWPVAHTVGLSMTIMASAPIAQPSVLILWNSEMRSSSGQPASGTPNGLFLKMIGSPTAALSGVEDDDFSLRPFEHESLSCSWHQMQ
jgi:hypothetical protein